MMKQILLFSAVATVLLSVVVYDLGRTQSYRDHCKAQGQSLSTVRGGVIICK